MRRFQHFPFLPASFYEQCGSMHQGCLADNQTTPAEVKQKNQHKMSCKHFLELAYRKHTVTVSWKKCIQLKLCYTHWQQFFERTILDLCSSLVEIQPLMPTAEFCASLTDNSTTFWSVSLSLGPSMVANIFHRCLVRSWPFGGIHRFLAGLFTFLSRQPTVSRLRLSLS